MDFADEVVKAAWNRQGGRCAKCGRWLVWAQRGRESITGAWQPHHRTPGSQEGCDALSNCVIFCSGLADCHFNAGHAGIDWSHYASMDDSALLYLRAGEQTAETAPDQPVSSKRGLIGAVFGVGQASPGKKRPAQKRKPKRNPQANVKVAGKKDGGDGFEVATDH